jgi:NADPH2:quinone reductase
MRAVQLTVTGGPEVLALVEVPDPVPGPGQVLIEVHAAGVTFADTMMRAGSFPAPLRLPAILGREVIGTVAAHGPDVHQPAIGSRVAARVPAGGYAERVAVRTERTVTVPDGVGDAQALGVLGSGLTALGVVDAGRVSDGEEVLITAAAGAIGSLAVQLAARRGARVIGLASTPAKRELILSLGAGAAFDSTADWESQLHSACDGRGIDVVLDSVAGPVLGAGMRLLAARGRHVLYGFAGGTLGSLETGQLGALMQRNLSLTGFTVDLSDEVAVQERIAELLSLVVHGDLHVPASDEYRLADAAEAHRSLAERRTSGKVMLRV